MEATQPPTYEYKCNKHLQQTLTTNIQQKMGGNKHEEKST